MKHTDGVETAELLLLLPGIGALMHHLAGAWCAGLGRKVMQMAKKIAKAKASDVVVLYMSERGEIACKPHAPLESSDTWRFDAWARISKADREAMEKELQHALQCEVCRQAAERKGGGDDGSDASGTAPAETSAPESEAVAKADADAADADPQGSEPDAAAKPKAAKGKGRKTKADMTLDDLAQRYVGHLEESGKSAGTGASYALELKTALAELGATTKLADLKAEAVLLYFGSDRVQKKRNGKRKSPLSIAKTQRVLRQALVWAEGKGWIEKAPLPETLATH